MLRPIETNNAATGDGDFDNRTPTALVDLGTNGLFPKCRHLARQIVTNQMIEFLPVFVLGGMVQQKLAKLRLPSLRQAYSEALERGKLDRRGLVPASIHIQVLVQAWKQLRS